jgi:protein involved in ribonucleotide reduction
VIAAGNRNFGDAFGRAGMSSLKNAACRISIVLN